MTERQIAPELLSSIYRTHTCGALRRSDEGKSVTLSGWVMRKRDHGGVVFIDLRDHYGITQVVFPGSIGEEAQKLKPESVLKIQGEVRYRGDNLVNPKIATGEIEVHVSAFGLLSTCELLPFQVAEDDGAPEAARLKYRFLELRREKLHSNIVLRTEVVRSIREIMYGLGFTEFSTPILTSSSPEGARDFIVPSRLHPGKFYALPQAPQQFKQLLMISGFDRYFQIAPCFRDEDSRADRSPGEFYQIDMELSFVEQEDVLKVNEQLFYRLFKRFSDFKLPEPPFVRIKYRDAFEHYGTDKPDLRIGLTIEDVSPIFKNSQFRVFQEALAAGGAIRAIKVDVPNLPSRKFFDDTVEDFKVAAEAGLAYLAIEGENVKGTVAKFVAPEEVQALKQTLKCSQCSVVFLAAGSKPELLTHLGKLRVKLGRDLGLEEKNSWKFCWITDFPFFEKDPETGAITFAHNPFSMPQGGLEALQTKSPLDLYAWQYDLVCQGQEICSGAIRNHTPDIMYKAFEIAGYSRETVDEKFGGMIRAFKFGAPPHGGAAPGVDRIVMLLAGEEAIREVIPFPLAQNGEDLLMGAPSTVTEKQLRETHIQLRPGIKP
jgi:aspartyl-tRNA synthetase